MTPYALLLYRQFKSGASVDAIAEETGIPRDRVRRRIEAAAAFVRRTEARARPGCTHRGRPHVETLN